MDSRDKYRQRAASVYALHKQLNPMTDRFWSKWLKYG
jgi:hypothetical protein